MSEVGLRGVRWSGWTHPGRFRPNNEDAFLAITFNDTGFHYLGRTGETSLEGGDCVFAVSDGMGGANAGEFASRIAIEKIAELMPRSFRLAASGFHRGGHDFLEQLIEAIHAEMIEQGEAYEETSGMGATLTLLWISQECLYFAHVGDSRLYYLPNHQPTQQVTIDHTHVGWLQRTGRISATEARFHPRRNQLQQVLGGRQSSVDPHIGVIEATSGDRLILTTDGVHDVLSMRALESLITSPPPYCAELLASDRLVQEAMDSSRDNLTAIVLELE